jgi:site-specific DNA-cytosine methylase
MKVLVACEESGVVREAFRSRGHDAWSCDILKSRDDSPYHIRAPIEAVLKVPYDWDLMIAHPPCTHLAVSGARWFKDKRAEQEEALDFVRLLMYNNIPRIAIENPVSIISSRIRKPDQIVQPWWFGDPYEKTTCLWLKNLPPLIQTNVVNPEPRHVTKSGRSLPKWYNLPPSEDRARIRSTTFQGFADAMAEQWGSLDTGS